jgi:hypothetical protein
MTLSTKGKVLAETIVNSTQYNSIVVYAANDLLALADVGLQFEYMKNGMSQFDDVLRLITLKDLYLPDILADTEIKMIVLNPAPKTPACKEFLFGSTIMGPKEQFVDYNLTSYKLTSIEYGKAHFTKKEYM